MPKIKKDFKVPNLDGRKAFEKISLEIPPVLEKFSSSGVKVKIVPEQQKVCAQGAGFSVELTVADEVLHLEADVTWLLMPFKGKIEKKIEDWVERHLKGNSLA